MRTHYGNKSINRVFELFEQLSADEKTRMLAEQRERALKDEASLLEAARRQGEKAGLEKGEQIGLEKGEQMVFEKGARKKAINIAKKLLNIGVLSIEQIADATGLSLDDVKILEKHNAGMR